MNEVEHLFILLLESLAIYCSSVVFLYFFLFVELIIG